MRTLTTVYRPAQIEDWAAIAQLLQLAAAKIADLIWQSLQTLQPQYAGLTPLQVGTRRCAQLGSGFSYRNGTAAEQAVQRAAAVLHRLIHHTGDVLLTMRGR
jgi:hypothetical protein